MTSGLGLSSSNTHASGFGPGLQSLSHTGTKFVEHTTTAVAAGAVASPFWLPWLQTASEVAATVAPIVGLIWLIVQITTKVYDTFIKNKDAPKA